ncbi:protein NCBP2AS2-like isoform X1 [Branchiostoma floridae x Branchiostoma belcheri]
MPFRALLRFLANHPQVVERLSETYVIRRLAQLTAYAFTRGKIRMEDEVARLSKSSEGAVQKASSFKSTFMREIQEGMKEANKKLKDQEKSK